MAKSNTSAKEVKKTKEVSKINISLQDLKNYRSRNSIVKGIVELLSNDDSVRDRDEKMRLKELLKACNKENNRIINGMIASIVDQEITSINRTYPKGSLVSILITDFQVQFKFKIGEIIYTEMLSTISELEG